MNLNENQIQAITSTKQKILVMAGAGSGKTTVLTERIRYLIQQGISPNDICAFTFTNKAARQMEFKLTDLPNLPTISTFHSYCYSWIVNHEFYPLLNFTKMPTLISETDKAQIIKKILLELQPIYSNLPFTDSISKIKNKAPIPHIKEEDELILNQVYQQYQSTLRQSNAIDFDDMIPLFIELYHKSKLVRELSQAKYLLVDECQDTNPIQYELIKLISSTYQNIFMVGDEDQLIYSFRSSNIKILKDFQNICDEVIILNQNYRCNQEILTKANQLISHNTNRLFKNLISSIAALHQIHYQNFDTTKEEAKYVATTIQALLSKGTTDIAILYRNNAQCYPLEHELQLLHIPYQLYGGKPFFEYKEIRSILHTYRLLFNPRNEIAFSNLYTTHQKIEYYQYKQFIKDYHNQTKNLIDYAATYPKFEQLGQSLQTLKIKLNQKEDIYQDLLDLLNYTKYLKTSNQQSSEYQRLMALKEMLENLDSSNLEDSFNQMLLDNANEIKRSSISLLTIHKAKGLEFDTVFLIGMNEGILPTINPTPENLEEERRLAYVALTRAKQRLYLTSSTIHYSYGNLQKLKPSSFLIEAGIDITTPYTFFGNYWYNK